jgi:hypothetical protein
MKKLIARAAAAVLTVALTLAAVLVIPQQTAEVQAATTTPKFYSSKYILTYEPGDNYSSYYTVLSIAGSPSASKIKNLKSTSSDIKVEAKNGYIKATFGDKAAKATISCKVNGTKISTVVEVKKYTNPCKSFKIGSTNFTSKFKTTSTYRQSKSFKKQKLSITMNDNWKITGVYVYNGSSTNSWTVNGTSFSKTISLTNSYSYVDVYCTNTKTGVKEYLTFYKSSY